MGRGAREGEVGVKRFYDGIRAFRGYMTRVHGNHQPYDWADLRDTERERYAEREATPRERRKEAR